MKTSLRAAIFFVICAAVGTGCSVLPEGGAMPIGSQCVVQFNRNLLGYSSNNTSSPTDGTTWFGIEGKLLRADSDWVVLDVSNVNRDLSAPAPATLWIPRSSVLLLQFLNEKPATEPSSRGG